MRRWPKNEAPRFQRGFKRGWHPHDAPICTINSTVECLFAEENTRAQPSYGAPKF
jgi:hypothetical protein